MNSPRLLNRHTLDNGLTLEFWDLSRPLVGDRRFVCLEARIAIPVRAETLPPELKAQAAQIVEALGEEIIFSQRQERNFIAASRPRPCFRICRTGFWPWRPAISGTRILRPGSSGKNAPNCRNCSSGSV